MFTALIIACSAQTGDCQAYVYPPMLTDKAACTRILIEGGTTLESKGLYVKDYACYKWPESA